MFNCFPYLNCFVLKCRVMLDIVLIKCCTSDVVPFLFIYVMCIIFLMDCFTFKHCLVSNFARVYFISYMSHLRKYLYIFNVLSFSLGQTRVPKCPNLTRPKCPKLKPNSPICSSPFDWAYLPWLWPSRT